MSPKHLKTILLGMGLLAYAATAQAVNYTEYISGGGAVNYTEYINEDGNNNSGPKTYAILVGSQAPSNNVADAVRGDLDVDHVASQLNWAADVIVLKYQWEGSNSVAGDIQSAASSFAAKVKPGDSFIFYYSGHGTGGSGYGVQDFINPVQGAGYQDNSLTAVFADSHYTDVNKFFLIDSCHSEGIWNNDTPDDRDLQTLSKISFLASSSEDGVAYSDSDLNGTSVFTNAILPVLTPTATFGSLLTSATAASGEVTGYLKDDGYGTGIWNPVGRTSSDFDLDNPLGGRAVPEPAALVLILAGAAAALVWRRLNRRSISS